MTERYGRPLEDIGFYTLSDERAKTASSTSPMRRCELLLTDKCNFSCVYCRGVREELRGNMERDDALRVLEFWAADGLENVRFSGGEPTLHPGLERIVKYAKRLDAERIAISTNGSAPLADYLRLVDAGVDDFSISLDACCAADAEKMAGCRVDFDRLVKNIWELSKLVYVTVGVVVTGNSISELVDVLNFAASLGVDDIRVIPSAQWDRQLAPFLASCPERWWKFPILRYRLENMRNGRHVRGLVDEDTSLCYLVLDDSAVAGRWHFPCIIYLREGGKPIGELDSSMRSERLKWFVNHDAKEDPICRQNCLDVCVDYNNRCRKFDMMADRVGA